VTPARIRLAASADREEIRGVHLCAFPAGENRRIATLAADLLEAETTPETISLVAEIGGGVVGHIAFSPVRADTHENWLGYILAPLGVKPEYQRAGIGTRLIEHGMELIAKSMAQLVFVYGDPKYYGRFGFSVEAAARFTPPYELQYPFGWQARVLRQESPGAPAVKLTCVAALRDPTLW
jgi:putative acetyltransferase